MLDCPCAPWNTSQTASLATISQSGLLTEQCRRLSIVRAKRQQALDSLRNVSPSSGAIRGAVVVRLVNPVLLGSCGA